MIPKESPFKFTLSPRRQAVLALIAMPLMMLLFWLPSMVGIYDTESHFPWTIAAAVTLLFAVYNSILSLSTSDQNRYWRDSIIAYSVVMVVGGLFAWILSGMSIYEAKSFRWLYIVFTFVYLLFLSIVGIMRKIIKIVQEQDARLRGEMEDNRNSKT